MEQRKKGSALAEIRGLFLGASALANWGRLTDEEKAYTAKRIERLVIRTEPLREHSNEQTCKKCGETIQISNFVFADWLPSFR